MIYVTDVFVSRHMYIVRGYVLPGASGIEVLHIENAVPSAPLNSGLPTVFTKTGRTGVFSDDHSFSKALRVINRHRKEGRIR